MDCTGVLELEEGTLRLIWGDRGFGIWQDYTSVLVFFDLFQNLGTVISIVRNQWITLVFSSWKGGHPRPFEGVDSLRRSHYGTQRTTYSTRSWPGGMRGSD